MAVLIILAVIAFVLIVRRRRKAMLAGLNATKPVFSIEPPSRRHHKLKRESL